MTVTLLCGLAFAGKSALAAAMARRLGVAVVSLDEINAARGLHGGTGIPVEEWAATHQRALRELESALREGRDVVVDDTNCFRFLRDNYRAVAGRFGAASVVVYIDAPLDVALQRLRSNEQTQSRPAVTESVMRELAEKFEHPSIDEATLVFHSGEDPDRWVEEHRSRLRSTA
ncbi:MAG: AAA family ATPase [Thermoanaerobaculia bacterium]